MHEQERTSVCEKVCALWKLSAELLREARDPRFGFTIAGVDSVEVLRTLD